MVVFKQSVCPEPGMPRQIGEDNFSQLCDCPGCKFHDPTRDTNLETLALPAHMLGLGWLTSTCRVKDSSGTAPFHSADFAACQGDLTCGVMVTVSLGQPHGSPMLM